MVVLTAGGWLCSSESCWACLWPLRNTASQPLRRRQRRSAVSLDFIMACDLIFNSPGKLFREVFASRPVFWARSYMRLPATSWNCPKSSNSSLFLFLFFCEGRHGYCKERWERIAGYMCPLLWSHCWRLLPLWALQVSCQYSLALVQAGFPPGRDLNFPGCVRNQARLQKGKERGCSYCHLWFIRPLFLMFIMPQVAKTTTFFFPSRISLVQSQDVITSYS